jgi:hypothetical protein
MAGTIENWWRSHVIAPRPGDCPLEPEAMAA